MEAQATYDDVNLVLRLYELRREPKLREAREWFRSTFHARNMEDVTLLCPRGSEQDAYFRMVTSYWEMVASFITSGVLNQELFFQSGHEMLFVWEKIRDFVPEARKTYKNPHLAKNIETVANSFIKWMNRQSPEAYATFSATVRGE
jgi:hypothetical protein